jgi:hypothetical protein
MTSTTLRRTSNALLILCFGVLLLAIGGRFGVLPRIASLRELVIVAFVLSMAARFTRRRARVGED